MFKSINNTNVEDLGLNSRKGTTTTKITLEQVDYKGNKLMSVGEQRPIIEAEGAKFKIKCAYYGKVSMAYEIPNESAGTVATRVMMTPMKATKHFDMNTLPQEVLDSESKGKVVDYLWKKEVDGKVVGEIVYNTENKRYEKLMYEQPQYKQRTNIRYEAFHKDTANVKEDEKGFYLLTFDDYHYVSPLYVAVVPGQKVTEAGTPIPNTQGIYLAILPEKSTNSLRLKPTKSSAQLVAGSKLTNVIFHPEFGIAKAEHRTKKGGLVKGTINMDVNASKINVFDVEGEVKATWEEAFKLDDFRPKGTRTNKLAEEEVIDKEEIKEELTAVVETKEEETTNFFD